MSGNLFYELTNSYQGISFMNLPIHIRGLVLCTYTSYQGICFMNLALHIRELVS